MKGTRLMILVLAAIALLPLPLLPAAAAPPGTAPTAALPLTPLMQWLTVATAFAIKPLYMALSLLLAWFLRRRRGADLVALKWAMVFFFLGELACAVNYLLFRDGSVPAEYLHMLGMAIAFGLVLLAVSEFLDERVIHFSSAARNCTLLAACGKCYKTAVVACSLRVIFMILLPCLALLCAMPLLVPVRPAAQDTVILGTPYTYAHPQAYQIFETRAAPAAAALFFLAALLVLGLRRERSWAAAKLLFAGGGGCLAFSLFRLTLFSLFRDDLPWFVLWEEWTEMLFVAAAWLALLVFRGRPLLAAPQP